MTLSTLSLVNASGTPSHPPPYKLSSIIGSHRRDVSSPTDESAINYFKNFNLVSE